MNKLILLTLIFLSLSNTSNACLNGESKILKDGTFLYTETDDSAPTGNLFNSDESYKIGIRRLDSLYLATKDLDYLSDKGVLLILLKQYTQAIKLYLEIEKLEPNRYSTASNIGTAYELIGQNKNALKWITKSIRINSISHDSSEWIHENILVAKIKGWQFYNTKYLLETEFGQGSVPITRLTIPQLSKLSKALYFQLNERTSFIKPKDKIVAQLFFDLGNIEYLLGNYYIAIRDYEIAKEYGFTGKLINSRLDSAEENSKKIEAQKIRDEESNKKNHYYLLGLLIIGIVLIAFYIIRRIKNNSQQY